MTDHQRDGRPAVQRTGAACPSAANDAVAASARDGLRTRCHLHVGRAARARASPFPSTARPLISRRARPGATRSSKASRSSAKTGSRAAWRSIAMRPSTSSSSWTAVSTIPCARGRLRLILRSIDLSSYGPNAWDTCPDRLSTVATPANSFENMFRRPIKLQSRSPSPAQPTAAIRPTTHAGDNLTSSTRIGPAASRGYRPYRYTMDRGGTVQKIPRCQCGAESFRLVKQGNQFSRWRFICTGCSAQKEVYQTDPFSLNLLKPLIDAGVPHQWSEINMIPVSYRASPVFYVQTARFIVFDSDPEVITLMGPSREDELAARVAMLHGFAGTDPSDERIKEQLERNGQGSIFAPYEKFRDPGSNSSCDRRAVNGAEVWADAARSTLHGWYEAGLVSREVSASPALQAQVHVRGNYARRYDPIRSTIEHDALRRRKVNLAGEAADLKLAHADLCAEYGTDELKRAYERRVADDLGRAGIRTSASYGTSTWWSFRSASRACPRRRRPSQKDRRMPVRLMGFPPLPSNKRPIYVIEQQNEAIYIQLDAGMVTAFLQCKWRPGSAASAAPYDRRSTSSRPIRISDFS